MNFCEEIVILQLEHFYVSPNKERKRERYLYFFVFVYCLYNIIKDYKRVIRCVVHYRLGSFDYTILKHLLAHADYGMEMWYAKFVVPIIPLKMNWQLSL